MKAFGDCWEREVSELSTVRGERKANGSGIRWIWFGRVLCTTADFRIGLA